MPRNESIPPQKKEVELLSADVHLISERRPGPDRTVFRENMENGWTIRRPEKSRSAGQPKKQKREDNGCFRSGSRKTMKPEREPGGNVPSQKMKLLRHIQKPAGVTVRIVSARKAFLLRRKYSIRRERRDSGRKKQENKGKT